MPAKKDQFCRIIVIMMAAMIPALVSSQDKSTVSPAIKTFALQTDITGAASNSVNLYTGDVALPINILSLTGHNGLDASVTIAYNSNVQSTVDAWNLESPAGILGLGWSMETPKIVCDNKQTGTREDDEYYMAEGGASNMLIRTLSGSDADGPYYVYETKNYQFWKIKFYYDPVEMGLAGSGNNKWVIIKEDGTKYIYGDKNSNRFTIQWIVRWSNWIGNSSQVSGQSRMANAWNLSEVINIWNEKITFEYENTEQFVGTVSGLKHTEASYLKTITDVWGRKASFIYKDKQSPYYMDPHTEQAEPDAYQEVYEKKYLDRIDVLSESSSTVLSVQFRYNIINSGTNSVKMLLASIVQKNAIGNSFPGIKFTYYTSGLTKGFLNTVTYPAGGVVTYTYTEKTLGHTNREFNAVAPAGFAEPKVWVAEDYVVVAWRQLGAGGSHDANPRDVKLYVYQWMGKWKEQFLQSITGVSLEGSGSNLDYKDFQGTVQKDFFGVLSRSTGNTYHLFARYKNQSERGSWLAQNITVDYGNGKPTLMSGTNFLAVGSFNDDATHPCHLYTFQGNSFKDDALNQTTGDHYYTASNNFLISHNMDADPNIFGELPEINFTFLTEDKKWVTRNWATTLEFTSNDPSNWHSSNFMAIAMADNNPEYAYRWDLTYTNFYRDSKDKLNADLFGQLADHLQVNIINNSLVGIDGRLARYDGVNWTTASISSTHNSPFGLYFSYGDDYVVRPTEYVSSTINYKGGRKVFNPNISSWEADVIMDGADRGNDFASAGIDYYYFGNGYYYRQTNGTWVKKFTYSSGSSFMWSKAGSPRFELFHDSYPLGVLEIRSFKSGELLGAVTMPSRRLLYVPYKFRSNGVVGQTIVTYSTAFSDPENATSIYLNRMVNEQVSGNQKDYPVTLVTVNDGINNQYTTVDYNVSKATVDPGGSVAQYNEVTLIPGSNTAASKPYGYTKTFFHNGLTSFDLGVPFFAADQLWAGSPYTTEVYDKNNVLKSSEKTFFQTFPKTIQNDVGTTMYTGNYARPVEVRSLVDNIETITSNSYLSTTGLIQSSSIANFDSKGNTAAIYYKYFWEQYDVNRTLNLLSPIIQLKKAVLNASTVYTEVSATTYKTWNSIYGPHKTYSWKRTGTPDFNFTSWSATGEPAADWIKVSEINNVSTNGNVLQVTNY